MTLTNTYPGLGFDGIKTHSFNKKITVNVTSFGAASVSGQQPDIVFPYPIYDITITNNGSGTIEYSKEGRTVDGELTPAASVDFLNGTVAMLWFRVKTGSTGPISIQASGTSADGHWGTQGTGTRSLFTADGDLSGTTSSQKVIGIQGNTVASDAPTDGYALIWSDSNHMWQPKPVATTSGSTTYEEKYIPDMTSWTQIDAPPVGYCRSVIRIGNTLYIFGGTVTSSATPEGKIYTASYTNFTGWTDAGVTVDGLKYIGSYICVINDTIYCYGDTIWSAPITDPINGWTSTGVTFTLRRDNYSIAVTPNHICVYYGFQGSPKSDVLIATISDPTSFISTDLGLGGNGWEGSAIYIDGEYITILGGVLISNRLLHLNSNIPTYIALNGTGPNSPFNFENCASLFHIGKKIHAVGYLVGPGLTKSISSIDDNLQTWYNDFQMLNKLWYSSNQSWISADGYAYVFGWNAAANGVVCYKSSRKKIYVTEPANANGLYTHRQAVTESGAQTSYTIHCQMGMTPWLTNRRDAF